MLGKDNKRFRTLPNGSQNRIILASAKNAPEYIKFLLCLFILIIFKCFYQILHLLFTHLFLYRFSDYFLFLCFSFFFFITSFVVGIIFWAYLTSLGFWNFEIEIQSKKE